MSSKTAKHGKKLILSCLETLSSEHGRMREPLLLTGIKIKYNQLKPKSQQKLIKCLFGKFLRLKLSAKQRILK